MIGAGGASDSFSMPIQAEAAAPKSALERRVENQVKREGQVWVGGDLEELGDRTRTCAQDGEVMRAGVLHVRGCLTRVTDMDSVPAAELGIVRAFAKVHKLGSTIPGTEAILGSPVYQAVLDFSEVYISTGPVRVNGVDIRPGPGAVVVVAPQADAIASSNATVALGSLELETRRNFIIDTAARAGSIPLGSFARAPAAVDLLGGFGLTGNVDVELVPGADADSGGAVVTVRLELPQWLQRGGIRGAAEARLRATTRDGLILEDMNIGPIDASIGPLGIEELKIAFMRGPPSEWRGEARACIAEDVCLDMTREFAGAGFPGGIVIRGGSLVTAGASIPFPDPGLPLFAEVYVKRIGFFMGLDPTRFGGAVDLRIARLLRIDGRLVLAFPSVATPWVFDREEVGSAFPQHFYGRRHTGTSVAVGADAYLIIPVVGELKLGGAYFLYEAPGYVAFGGGIQADFVGVLQLTGRVDGEINAANGRFSFVGQVEACIADVVCGGAVAAVSSAGAGGCVKVGPVSMGGGVQWARVARPFLWAPDGCKWSRFIEPNVRGSRAAGAQVGDPHIVRIERGDPSRVIRLDGDAGAPLVRVTGPGGETLVGDPGPGVTMDDDIRILRSEQLKATVVGLINPRPGTWRIEPVQGSPAVSRITEAEDQPDAKVVARVRGRGDRRTLVYNVLRRRDQRVTFIESAVGGKRTIGTVTGGGRGSLRFTPAPGRGRRTIEAQFELAGMPAERLTVARFSPPSPRLARPTRVRAKRRGKTLVVSWSRVRGAARYEVVTNLRSGTQRLAKTGRTRVAVRGIRRSDGGRVRVRAMAELKQGKPRAAPFRALERARTRVEPLPRVRRGRR